MILEKHKQVRQMALPHHLRSAAKMYSRGKICDASPLEKLKRK